MRRLIYASLFMIISIFTFANNGDFGIVYDEDFKAVGVSESNLKNAKNLMERTGLEIKKLSLVKKQLELEANKLMLDGAEKNLIELEKVMDRLGTLESERLKNQIRSQIQMYKYITRQQYINAREIAIERLKREQQSLDKVEGEINGDGRESLKIVTP